MELDGPPTWRMKKFTKEYFINVFGRISSSARFVLQMKRKFETILNNFLRYSSLRINGTAVYVWYDSDSGEFKFSGRYGIGY